MLELSFFVTGANENVNIIRINQKLFRRIFFILKILQGMGFQLLKDAHREKLPSNKIPALQKSMNMGIWVVGTAKQFFIRGS